MIDGLKPYSEYIESGSPWLGKVPAHWQVKRLGSILRERGETNDAGQVSQVLSVLKDIGVIPYEEKGNIGNKKSEDIARYKIVHPNDIVVNCMNVIIGSVGLSKYTGCLSPVYYVLTRRLEADNPLYLNAVFQTKPFQQSLVRIGNGILAHRMRIPMDLLKCEPFPKPPPEEQNSVVRFLNYADRRIKRYIKAKKKVITLLNEQKQLIIHRAVTYGLDSNVPLKPSGIPYLGDIPEHWGILLLGRCVTRIEQGWSPVAAEGDLTENQWAVLTLSSVKRGKFNSYAIKPISMTADVPCDLEVHKGDFLLTRSNTRNLVGDVCVVENVRPKTILSDLIYRLRIKRDILDPQFLMYELLSPLGRGQIERDARGSSGTMPKLAQGHIKSWRILLPPLREQGIIIEHIVNETRPFNLAITKAQSEIDLIQEYRTRLIADVVTGKLDVREAAGKLPTEADKIEELTSDISEEEIEEIEASDGLLGERDE